MSVKTRENIVRDIYVVYVRRKYCLTQWLSFNDKGGTAILTAASSW